MDWKDIVLMKIIWPAWAGGGGGGSSTFETSSAGWIPDYEHGYATAELTSDAFETSAVGEIAS